MVKKKSADGTYPIRREGVYVPTRPPAPGAGTYDPPPHYGDGASFRIELVPKPMWGISGYRLLRGSRWTAIRRQVVEEARNACSET